MKGATRGADDIHEKGIASLKQSFGSLKEDVSQRILEVRDQLGPSLCESTLTAVAEGGSSGRSCERIQFDLILEQQSEERNRQSDQLEGLKCGAGHVRAESEPTERRWPRRCCDTLATRNNEGTVQAVEVSLGEPKVSKGPDAILAREQGPSSSGNFVGDGAKREDAKENVNSGGGDETLFEGIRRIMGPWGAVAVAGVAAYLTVVHVFWDVFRSYFAWSEALAITIADGLPRLSVLDLFGSVLTCQSFRRVARFPKHAVETLVACSIMQFGGTLLVGVVVLGQTPSWMSSSTAWPALAFSWWLTFFSPWDLWHGRAMKHKAVVFVAAFGRAISASHAITSWGADKALTAHFEKARVSPGCAILCGTLAGCGGGILADLLNLEGDSWKLQRTPGALASPSFSVQRCFGASCLYYVLADPHGYLAQGAPFPLSWLGSWSVAHGGGPSAEAAAIVAVYVTANHLLDYFIPNYEDPLCVAFKLCLKLLGVTSMVNPAPILVVDVVGITDKRKIA